MTPARTHDLPRRILVTGAGGFIGSHLAEALAAAGHQVTALVHYNALQSIGNLAFAAPDNLSRMRLVFGDVCDPEQMQSVVEGHDVILNLAALIGIPYSCHAPRTYLRTNVEGAMNLLEAARRHGVKRFVQISTSEVYGSARLVPMDESHPLQAQSPYAASKIAADAMAEAYRRNFNVPTVVIRPFNTYGPRQSERAVIPSIIAQALNGGPVRIGATDPVRDFTFVDDTVSALVAAALLPDLQGGPYNLGVGTGVSIAEVAARIFDLLDYKGKMEVEPQRMRPPEGEVDRLVADNARWRARSGWVPCTSLDEGLRRTIAAMKAASPARLGGYVI